MFQSARFLSTTIGSPAARSASITTPVVTNLSPSVTKIQVVPSYPVYIAKGSLLSVYSTNVQSLSISNHYLQPLRRIIQGFHRFRYERLESTVASTVLISSSLKNKSNSHVLRLDGTRDWAILPRDAILAYIGKSLRIDTLALPSVVNKKLKWYQFSQRVKTGLAGPLRPGYSLVTGRGDLVVRGEGEIYGVELGEDEEFLVKRGNVVGISVNGDLAESTEEYQLKKFIPENIKVEEIIPSESENANTEIVEVKTDPLKQIKDGWRYVTGKIGSLIKFVNESLPSNDEFIKITGPRSVLIKSQISQSNLFKLKEEESVLKKE